MPRQARIDFPGALNHVIGRAVEKKHIFADDRDKKEFSTRLLDLLSKCSIQCYAWCIMDNHFHLLLITGKTPLAEFMSRLLTGYAIYYNWAHKRVGHLFQNRYKSIICDTDEYLLPLIRYIHLNPVRARIVSIEGLKKYRWAGHSELLDKRRKDAIINREAVLGYFGETERKALESYDKHVRDGVGLKEDYCGGGLVRSAGGVGLAVARKKGEYEMYDDRILGDGGFVESVCSQMEKEDKHKRQTGDIEDILNKVGSYFGAGKDDLLYRRDKELRKARSVSIYFAYKYLGKTVTNTGRVFGIQQSAATSAIQRGKEISDRDGLENRIFG